MHNLFETSNGVVNLLKKRMANCAKPDVNIAELGNVLILFSPDLLGADKHPRCGERDGVPHQGRVASARDPSAKASKQYVLVREVRWFLRDQARHDLFDIKGIPSVADEGSFRERK